MTVIKINVQFSLPYSYYLHMSVSKMDKGIRGHLLLTKRIFKHNNVFL